MSINYFIPTLRSSPSELTSRLSQLEERKSRFDRAKDQLEQEYIEYSRQASRSPQYDGIMKLKKTYNLLSFENEKKQKIIKDLLSSISCFNMSRPGFSQTTSRTLKSPLSTTSVFEKNEYRLKELKEQIKNTYQSIEEENFLGEQLERMKLKEKSEVTAMEKKIKEFQGFYTVLSRYDRNIEKLKAKADNDRANAYEAFSLVKKNINKSRRARLKAIFAFKKKEAVLFQSLKYMQKKFVEETLLSEDIKTKKEHIVKNLESALDLYDSNKTIQLNSIDELNHYSINFEKIKQLLRESKTLEIPESVIENVNMEEIYQIFSQMQSLETHLQIKYSNLTLNHSLLDEKVLQLRQELEMIRSEDNISEKITSIKQYAHNLHIDDATYSGLRINLETKTTFNEESLEINENMAIFLLKFILEISYRMLHQLDFIKSQTDGHPKILEIYLEYITKILKELQNGFMVKLKNIKKKVIGKNQESPVRRQSFSKTTVQRYEEINNTFSKFTFEKFRSHTQAELFKFFLKEFPGCTKDAELFSKLLYFNSLHRHFTSQNDLIKFLKESKEINKNSSLVLQNLGKLFFVSHKNLRKIVNVSVEILIDILRKVNLSVYEVKKTVETEKIDKKKKNELLNNYENEMKKYSQSIDTQTLLRAIFEHKIKVLREQNQIRNLNLDFDKLLTKFSINDNHKMYNAQLGDDINNCAKGIHVAKKYSGTSKDFNEDFLNNLVQRKQYKGKSHAQSNKFVKNINDKNDLLKEIKKIQIGINTLKKGEHGINKEDGISWESSPSHDNFPMISSPIMKKLKLMK